MFKKFMKKTYQNLFTILGKAIGLPDHFLALKNGSTGGGVIQVSISKCS